ncbi:MAG: DUF2752 domain-containing protein [Wenzhouxiangella sp.]|nr:MAG: DUF2752 domain-containing protein [Wenzhouxiangella sp.]
MRLVFKVKPEPDLELIGLAVVALVIPALAIWLVGFEGSLPRNGLHEHLGIPCAFCGGTRSLTYFFSGDFSSAFAINPLVATGTLLTLAGSIYAAAVVAFSFPRPRLILESLFELRLVVALCLFLLLSNWVYVWLMGI